MSRLIDADKFLTDESEAFMSSQLKVKDEALRIVNAVVHEKVQMLIMDAPTVDAVKVVHGHWIFDQHRWFCSECNENPTLGMGYVQSERGLYKYCPKCGARMETGRIE